MSIPTQNLHITPSNVLSSGKISYKSGNPVIQFIVGEQSRALLGQSIRVCGNLVVYADNAKALCTSADNITINSRLGAYALIDQLVIKSQKTHAVIEHIRHYGRAMASFLPYSANTEDEVGHMSESSLTMPNEELMKGSVVDIASGKTSANNFCMHLPCGLFNGTQAIPLDLVGGLLIEIHLAPDQNVLSDTTGSVIAKPNAFYELSDIFLACEAQIVSAPPSVSTFEYNSLSSYFASFNSTNAIINFNLGLNNVLSVFANCIPASHINNLGYDGFSTMPPVNSDGTVANIDQIVFTRGGEKFPIEYNIDTLQKDDATYRPYDPQLQREGASAVRKFSKMARTMASPNNSYLQKFTNGTTKVRDSGYVDGGNCFILGVNYDSISNQGVSFATQNWGMNMTTGLTTENPHALFLFVHSKNTLVFDGKGGMQVIS
jgi:hypothetical protein